MPQGPHPVPRKSEERVALLVTRVLFSAELSLPLGERAFRSWQLGGLSLGTFPGDSQVFLA